MMKANQQETISIFTGNQKIIPNKCLGCGMKGRNLVNSTEVIFFLSLFRKKAKTEDFIKLIIVISKTLHYKKTSKTSEKLSI